RGSSPVRNALACALSFGVSDRSALPTRRGAIPIAAASALPSDAPPTLSMARRNQDVALSLTARAIHSSAKARKPSQTVAATSPVPLCPESPLKLPPHVPGVAAGKSRVRRRPLAQAQVRTIPPPCSATAGPPPGTIP